MRSLKLIIMLVVAWSVATAAAMAEERQQVTAMDGVTYGLMPKGVEWMNPGDTHFIGVACDEGSQTSFVMKTYQCTWIQQVVATETGLVLEPGGSEAEVVPNFERLVTLVGMAFMVLSMVSYILSTRMRVFEMTTIVSASAAAAMTIVTALLILSANGWSTAIVMALVAGVVGFVPHYVLEKEKPHSVYWLATIVYLGLMAAVFVQV